MQATCTARSRAPLAPHAPWIAGILAAVALAGALAAAVIAPGARDLTPRHTAATLRATAI
jgi:hypothetical protein